MPTSRWPPVEASVRHEVAAGVCNSWIYIASEPQLLKVLASILVQEVEARGRLIARPAFHRCSGIGRSGPRVRTYAFAAKTQGCC